MLNIKLTLSGGVGLAHDIWHMTESHRIHSQELLLLALLLVLLATCISHSTVASTDCVYRDGPGLASIIVYLRKS